MTFPKLNKYTVIRKVCKKYCFILYEATDDQTGQQVYLRMLDDSFTTERSYTYSFLKSARFGGILDHENIAQIFHYGKDRNHHIIASEYYQLQPLNLFMHEHFPLEFERVLDIVGQISRTVRQAHLHGVVHGLLNPSSIFISGDGSLKIDDFAYHWLAPYLHELEDAEAIYLSYHIAPEVYKGHEIDGRADVYSLAIILLQLLTDCVPFNYLDHLTIPNKRLNLSLENIRSLFPNYPKRLERVFARALANNPELRFQSLGLFERELEELRKEYSYDMELAQLESELLQAEG